MKAYGEVEGRAVAQAVSRWLPITAARVRVRAACGICGGQSGTGTDFLRVLRFPLPIIPPISPSSYSLGAGTIGHWWPQCRVDPTGLHPPLYRLKKRFLYNNSWNSAVGIATGYGLDDRRVGVRVLVGSRIFSSLRRPDRLWGPPNLLSNEYRRPVREADHSPPTTTEVKKMWIYKSTPSYAFMV
jgi:hypothetical protein